MTSKSIKDDILSYREMCDAENKQTLQRGMNYRLNPAYSVILMSQRSNAPYKDRILEDGVTIEYEGHDVSKIKHDHDPKSEDQASILPSGKLTQNGLFIRAVEAAKSGSSKPEIVKTYEKIIDGVWSLKGYFDLVDYKTVNDGNRNVYRFILTLSDIQKENLSDIDKNIQHNRIIPSEVKKEVWKRDQGKCVKCGSTKNLHFDHDLPYAKGGTSLTASNVQLLCMKCNLSKSDNIQ